MNKIKWDGAKHYEEQVRSDSQSGVTRDGLLWSRDLHDMQEPPAKRVQEGGPFQAQRTTGTNSPEQERHLGA